MLLVMIFALGVGFTWWKVQQVDLQMRTVDPKYRFVFLIGRKGSGLIFFFVDSEASDSPDYWSPARSTPKSRMKLTERLTPRWLSWKVRFPIAGEPGFLH